MSGKKKSLKERTYVKNRNIIPGAGIRGEDLGVGEENPEWSLKNV